MLEQSLNNPTFLGSLEELFSKHIDDHGKNKVSLFMISTNANEFDYSAFAHSLLESIAGYAVSRAIRDRYVNEHRYMELSKRARERFRDYTANTGELGELILYSFLEEHLKAPKILTKLELKTSTSLYVNGSDGIHYLKLLDGNYQLIFGESKTIRNLPDALNNAFCSIDQFKRGINAKGNAKSGIAYEKGLISDHLCKEFPPEDAKFLESLIYPQMQQNHQVDDAFAIFIGYEMEISVEEKSLQAAQFRELVRERIRLQVTASIGHIITKIQEFHLAGHNFYIYILPFTSLDASRSSILSEVLR